MSVQISRIFILMFLLSIAIQTSAMTTLKKRSLKQNERYLNTRLDNDEHYYTLFYGDWTKWIWGFVFIADGFFMCYFGLKYYKWFSFTLGAMLGVCVGLYIKSRLEYDDHVDEDSTWTVIGLLLMVIALGVLGG